jgi:hypothetical protein
MLAAVSFALHPHAKVLFANAEDNTTPAVVASKEVADAGILNATMTSFLQEHKALLGSNMNRVTASSSSSSNMCTVGYIDCVNGYVRNSNPKKSCATACDGKCCVGNGACTRFTGKVCKDGSCSGYWSACMDATIPKVVNSCHGHTWSCLSAGKGDPNGKGKVESIINSCNDDLACHILDGKENMGQIIDSCNGLQACKGVGTVTNIISSCNSHTACYKLGLNGAVGDVSESCNGFEACKNAVVSGVVKPLVNNCCNGDQACYVCTYGYFNSYDDVDVYICMTGATTFSDQCQLTSQVQIQTQFLSICLEFF